MMALIHLNVKNQIHYSRVSVLHLLMSRKQVMARNMLNPIALRMAKIVCNFGFSVCNRVKKIMLKLQ